MSYCVNCGVKLKEDARCCPLCDCPVINPYVEFKKISGENPPSPPVDTAPVADRWDLTHFILALTLALAAISCGIVDLCISKRLTWSIIAISGCITAYVGVCLPMKKRKLLPELFVLFDLFAALLTISVVAWRIDSFGWALRIAFPLAAAVAVCAAYMVNLVRRHKIRYFHIIALGVSLAGVLCILTELLINRGTDISWSGIAAISCVLFSAVLCIIAKSRRLTRRFHL